MVLLEQNFSAWLEQLARFIFFQSEARPRAFTLGHMRCSFLVVIAALGLMACGSSDGDPDGHSGGVGGKGGGGAGASAGAGGRATGGSGGTGGSVPPVYEDVDELVTDASLAMPEPGTYELHVISPSVLEVRAITTKDPDPAQSKEWNVIQGGTLSLPPVESFAVTADGAPVTVTKVGFRRRVLYAPLAPRDLRIDNRLFLELSSPLGSGAKVAVVDGSHALWPASVSLSASVEPLRTSPAIHVNQVGYLESQPKKARVGYWLGSLGELPAPSELGFELVRTKDSQVVFEGKLGGSAEAQDGFIGHPYQAVMEADFTSFDQPGNYRLRVAGLGASYPFWIGNGAAAAFARTYALGLYHQRCGQESALPYTRFERGACHSQAAQIPTMAPEFEKTNALIANTTKDFPKQSAPIVTNVDASLYPIQKTGSIDVSGGHHDAGDYSKYIINSAFLIHHLVFAVDAFPGVAELDNLGIPESGDGKSDLLYEAKWEADFLAKMQDSDGGFFTSSIRRIAPTRTTSRPTTATRRWSCPSRPRSRRRRWLRSPRSAPRPGSAPSTRPKRATRCSRKPSSAGSFSSRRSPSTARTGPSRSSTTTASSSITTTSSRGLPPRSTPRPVRASTSMR